MKILRYIEKNFERGIASLFISIIAMSLIIQIFYRYVLSSPLTWPPELISFIFPWFVYLGASYGVREGAHIRLINHITILPQFFHKPIRLIADICWLIYSIFMIFQGIYLVDSMFQYQYMGQVFKISKAYVYMIIPIAFTLIAIRISVNIVLVFIGKTKAYSMREQKQLLD